MDIENNNILPESNTQECPKKIFYWYSDLHTQPTNTHTYPVKLLTKNCFWQNAESNDAYKVISNLKLKQAKITEKELLDENIELYILGENTPVFELNFLNATKCIISDKYLIKNENSFNKIIELNNTIFLSKNVDCIVIDSLQSSLERVQYLQCKNVLFDNIYIDTNGFSLNEYFSKISLNNCVVKTLNGTLIPSHKDSKLHNVQNTIIMYNNSLIYKFLEYGASPLIYPFIVCNDNTYFKVNPNYYTIEGKNSEYNSGNGNNNELTENITVGGNWLKLALGKDFAVAIKDDNTLWGWGKNVDNIFGEKWKDFTHLTTPTLLDDENQWLDVAACCNSFIAIYRTDIEFNVCVSSNFNRLTTNLFTVIATDSLKNYQPKVKASGGNMIYNVNRDFKNKEGIWYGLGDNTYKQLHEESSKIDIPLQITLSSTIEDIFVGDGFLIYKTSNNQYYGIGNNTNKQLDINNVNNIIPLSLLPLTGDFIQMSLNTATCAGVTIDRKVYEWGREMHTNIDREQHEILKDDEWEQIVVSDKATIAMNTNDHVYMYGYVN